MRDDEPFCVEESAHHALANAGGREIMGKRRGIRRGAREGACIGGATMLLLHQRSRRHGSESFCTKVSRLPVFQLYDVYFNRRGMACQSPSGKYRTFCFNIISTLRTVQKLTQISLRPLGLRHFFLDAPGRRHVKISAASPTLLFRQL
jgi:hypothetical protein